MRPLHPQDLARAADILGLRPDELADAIGRHDGGRPLCVNPEARAAVFREMGARHFEAIQSKRARAIRLREMLAKYEAGAWRRRDQFLDDNPHAAGSRLGDAWCFLRKYRVVPSIRTIRKSWPPDLLLASVIPERVPQQTEQD